MNYLYILFTAIYTQCKPLKACSIVMDTWLFSAYVCQNPLFGRPVVVGRQPRPLVRLAVCRLHHYKTQHGGGIDTRHCSKQARLIIIVNVKKCFNRLINTTGSQYFYPASTLLQIITYKFISINDIEKEFVVVGFITM